jgi:fibronectin type III domain protein
VLSASTAPAAPTAVDAIPQSSSSIALYWAAPSSSSIDGFRVERSKDAGASWSSAGTVPWVQTSVGDFDLVSDQQVCYRVFAFNSAGDSPPSTVDCATPPAAPTGLSATPVEGLAIDLNWIDTNVEEGYEVRQLIDDCTYWYCYQYWVTIAFLGADVTSYRVSGLNDGQFYWFAVIALKDGGYSDPSEAGSIPGPAIP